MSQSTPSDSVPGASARRVFLALPVEDEARHALSLLSSKLGKAAQFTPARLAWVPSENYHVTVHFLGRIEEDKIARLLDRLPAFAAGFQTFSLHLKGLGYFPHAKAPNVLWAGVSHPPKVLGQIYAGLSALIVELGLETPRPDFHPHVTLARFKGLKGSGVFVRQAGPHQNAPIATMRVGGIDLMESHLGSDGAVYERIGGGEFAADS